MVISLVLYHDIVYYLSVCLSVYLSIYVSMYLYLDLYQYHIISYHILRLTEIHRWFNTFNPLIYRYINGLGTGLTWAANGSEPQYIVMTLLPRQPVQHVFNVKDGKYCKQCHFDHLCGYISNMFEHWLPNNMIKRTQKEQPQQKHTRSTPTHTLW